MTYGEMPTLEKYEEVWDRLVDSGELAEEVFHFTNDKRVGTCAMRRKELWEELQRASAEYQEMSAADGAEDPEEAGQWISSVLYCLGFEWV